MLKLLLALFQDVGNHDARDQGEPDRDHEGKVKRLGCRFALLEGIEDRVGSRRDLELQVWRVDCVRKDALIHELRVEGSDVLGSDVEEARERVGVILLVGLIDLEGSIAVRIEWLNILLIVYLVVEVSIVRETNTVFNRTQLEGRGGVREFVKELLRGDIICI